MRTSFYVLAGGFLTGVVWRSFFYFNPEGVIAVLLGVVLLVVSKKILSLHWHTHYVALAVLACLLGVVRTELAYQTFQAHEVFDNGETVQGVGVVVGEVDVREEYAVMYVELEGGNSRYAPRLRVKTPLFPVFAYGERVSLAGVVHKPESFETDSGRTFDYPGYLMKEYVQYELRDGHVESLGEFGGNPVVRTLLALKYRWLNTVSLLVPEPSASLAGGLVVGAKRSLGEGWLDAFRDTGIIHIVVLSGYNLTLVANSIFRFTSFLPSTLGLGFGVAGVFGFALMVGGGATVVRASVMAVLGLLAVYLKSPYLILRALVLAAVCMVMWNPFVLVFDSGFQLSFLATLRLVFVSPYFEKRLPWITPSLGMRGIVAATCATQLVVLPLLLYQVGTVSLVAPFVNVLVLPFVSPVMLLSFAAGVLGFASMPLAIPFAWVAHLLMSYMFLVVKGFALLPFASIALPVMPWWVLILLYVVPLIVYSYKYKTAQRKSLGG